MKKNLLNRVLNRWGRMRFSYVNWWATLLFNLRAFDLRTALRLPVYVYNGVDVYILGRVVLDAKHIYRGMVRIGYWPMKAHNRTRIWAGGTLIFHGSIDIWGGAILEIGGTLELGDNVMLGETCKIMCHDHITFQDHIRVGYEVTFMDTDFHYILNTETHTVHRNTAPVVIGSGTWISSTCKIMKGTHLPPCSIVGGGSLVNRDYSQEAPCQIYVGTPAKPVKGNQRRIFNVEVEKELNRYFDSHPDVKTRSIETGDNLDRFCFDHFFKKR